MLTPEQSPLLAARRAAVARRWDLRRGAVLVPSGLPVPISGSDQFHDFHAHPEHYYLSGADAPGSVLAFDPADGWTLFAPVATEDERVWVGDTEPFESLAARTGLDRVQPVHLLEQWLERRRAEPVALIGNDDFRHKPAGYRLSNFASLELEFDDELSFRLSEAISESRRTKDPAELEFMRLAAAASHRGHLAGIALARPGMTERELQIEIEAEFFRAGSPRTAYGSIVGSGPNGAILHSTPAARRLRDGDIVLVDAGAEIAGYASDVTRTFPVASRFTGIQRDLYQLVHDVQAAAIADVRPGQEFRELHLDACRRIARGLVDLDILRGNPDDLVQRDVHAIFFPHGLGHMLGLATHDAGGCLAGRERSNRFGLKYLRADLPLEPGYVVTIEPGIYFIETLLTDPARRQDFADAINWDRVDRLLDFGGIRIEDDILVTGSGAEILSGSLPRTIDEIEALRQEGLQG
jgi:Xaa-Pro aminopeptidase